MVQACRVEKHKLASASTILQMAIITTIVHPNSRREMVPAHFHSHTLEHIYILFLITNMVETPTFRNGYLSCVDFLLCKAVRS